MGLGEGPVEDVGVDPAFWAGRRVLVTGFTGFKGGWLTLWLEQLGAEVTGLANAAPTSPSLYDLARVGEGVTEVMLDICDAAAVRAAFAAEPEIVIHMAAQPLVRRSFEDPRGTYDINVMGTVNVLEAVRATPSVRAVVNVTSDLKGGHDPYSTSKTCAGLIADSYRHAFFETDPDGPRLGTARAGNVIGGGDWGKDRLIPDIIRRARESEPIPIRNPVALRPWQHALDPLSGYLMLAQALVDSPERQGDWVFGPAPEDERPVGWIVERLDQRWDRDLEWEVDPGPHPPESGRSAMDSSRANMELGWNPTWDLGTALDAIVAWYEALDKGEDVRDVTLAQIESYAAGRREVTA
jgi:CDP-glucose 4,6-dehydratase